MGLHDPTHLYEGDISPGTEKVAKVISAVSYPPFLSAVVFILLSFSADTLPMAVLSMLISVTTSLVIPVTAIMY